LPSARTGTQIISDALKQLGNETLTSEAQVWLNNFLDRLYEDYRWPFQEKTATGTVTEGQTSVDLPSDFLDFWDRNGLRLEDEDGNLSRVLPRQADEFDLVVQPNDQGQPEIALVDLAALTWQPYPTPDKTYTWILRYKYKPARITDFGQVITFSNDELLTQAVFVKGLQFEDDDRYVPESQVLELMIKRFRRGYNVSPLKGKALRYQSQTFRGITAFR
jgi:hypothetical protein